MPTVLETIIDNKKLEVDSGKYSIEVKHLPTSTRSLKDSILSRAPGLILECKAASPSKGLIAENYQPEKLAQAYQPFAAAISVLTDEKFFQGNMEHLKLVSETTDLPVLCKDFIISKEQIICARAYGADAILLMLSVLTDEQYRQLALQAKLLELDILTEVHDEDELDRAVALGAKIIGVNNRDLATLKIDMQTTQRLSAKIPKHCLLISESGYSTREQFIQAFSGYKFPNGFLVGSHLSGSKDTALALRELLFGQVKICGLTRIKDAQSAYDHGASYGGLIFSGKSPRNMTLKKATKLSTKIPLKWVGVFTEISIDKITKIAEKLKLSAVQIHWLASKQQLMLLRKKLPENCEIWLLVRINSEAQILSEAIFDRDIADRYLIEPKGDLAGGNGIQFNWQLLNESTMDKSKIILAGGIDPDNVKQAIATGVTMIDVNSGVESSAGIKSSEKITALFKQLLPGKA